MKIWDFDKYAAYYDILELASDKEEIDFLDSLFRKKVKTILDIATGTGAQAIALTHRGYKVTAADISSRMLAIARKKARGLPIKFTHADMRTAHLGTFDAVIAIFNAIGNLTKPELAKAMGAIHRQLKPGGLFVFDILNLRYMRTDVAGYRYIDVCTTVEDVKFVRFNKDRLSKKGILTTEEETFIQEGYGKPLLLREIWDLQLYEANELRKMLSDAGFSCSFYGPAGKRFVPHRSWSIVAVATKQA